jgi:hypothetical protein
LTTAARDADDLEGMKGRTSKVECRVLKRTTELIHLPHNGAKCCPEKEKKNPDGKKEDIPNTVRGD